MSAKILKTLGGIRALLGARAVLTEAIVCAFAIMLSTAAGAATITVNSLVDPGAEGICALRDAITAANSQTTTNGCAAGSGNDTIQFSLTGTILVASTLPQVTDAQLTINGPASPGITIDGGNEVEIIQGIMQVASAATLNLNNLKVANGFASRDGSGGGIFSKGTLTVTNCTFSGNRATFGGAIRNSGTMTVTNSTFSANRASFGGGAIENGGTMTVTNSTFSANRNSESGGAGGGAIDNGGTLTVTNSTFSGNGDSSGAGGGAIENDEGTLTVTNSTLSGNSAASLGGAIFNFGGAVFVTNGTFSGDSAASGSGISNEGLGTTSFKNTILAASSKGGNCSGTIVDAGYNISDDNSCGFSASGSHNSTDPKLDPAGLSNNGGPTQTIALLPGSPAIDSIPLASCTDQAGKPLTTDQRGFARPDAGETVCDIGAYEFQHASTATIFVNSLGDPSVEGSCTLHDAITAADTMTAINGCTAGGDINTIQFRVTGTISPTDTLPPVTNILSINGPASPGITIDGGNAVQIIQVASGATLNLNNLTIAHGFATNGGGILSVGALTVTNSTFAGNTASEGGAIFDSGTLSITNSTFAGNTASEGGAIFNSGTLIVNNSTFAGNSGDGGSFFNAGSASLKNTITAVSTSSPSSCSGPIADAGYNISDDNSCGFSATGSRNGTNPELDPKGLGNNGGPTQTIALLLGSPAIDAIPLASCTDQRGAQLTTDQRGVVRPDAGENVCDIGAFEVQDSLTTVVGVIKVPAPTATTAVPGSTVSSGKFTLQNTSGTTLVTQMVMISFGNADLFSSATLTATVGSNTSTATVNPLTGGNSPPANANNTLFPLQLAIPTDQTATFSLAVTVSAKPQLTRRDGPVMYAAMVGGGPTTSNALLVALALLELCAVGMGSTRRRWLLALGLLLVLAGQVSCNNSSGGASNSGGTAGTESGVVHSTQTAVGAEANNQLVSVVGAAEIGTVSVSVK